MARPHMAVMRRQLCVESGCDPEGRPGAVSSCFQSAEFRALIISWDRTDGYIWFGRWNDTRAAAPLYLVVERLPASNGWDWAVWQSDKPRILRRGRAPSAHVAATAAEAAADRWHKRSSRTMSEQLPG
jgi:hypothetical protein